jgi:prepilin-type N-terminal cleavage/methylation domain-containing protein/prepilin-type processing-associated H-X9-DG protein
VARTRGAAGSFSAARRVGGAFMTIRSRRRGAFTLIELLVVIGIIAILMSILIPTLRGVRRQAYVVQCSSNMKQVATALIMYIQENKGRHPPAGIPPLAGIVPGGWWWPNELVRLNYLKNPGVNVYKKTPSAQAEKVFNRNSVFRCPEGIDEGEQWWDPSFPGGDYPTDANNNGYTILNDSTCAANGFGVPSWYQLNSRVCNNVGSMAWPGGSQATPFVWFNTTDTKNDPTVLKDKRYQRTWGCVKRSGELIMLVEAPNPNWYDQTESAKYKGLYMKRLAARHGKKSADGANAYTNMAFFDGHVALFFTKPFNTGPTNNVKMPADKFTAETIFWVGNQRGK